MTIQPPPFRAAHVGSLLRPRRIADARRARADNRITADDLAAADRKAVHAVYAAGCRYLKMDDIFFACLCDPRHRAAKAAAGQDPDWLIDPYAFMLREAIFSTGADVSLMEYDTDRAGGLEPLRLLPKGKQRVMPRYITTKTAELEDIDDLRRKFDEAAKFADLDQPGLAPQCGFASTEEGNAITEDDRKRKLELAVRTAEAIWGSA